MGQKVLIVDDERAMTELLEDVLATEPYTLLSARSAEEALQILEEQEIDVVVSDEMMPGMSGSELLAIVKERYPDTIRMILTGHASLEGAIRAINEGEIYRFFTKPCNVYDLAITIRQALQQRSLIKETRKLLEVVKQQSRILEELEGKYPGITKVKRDASGEVILEEDPEFHDYNKLILEIKKTLQRRKR